MKKLSITVKAMVAALMLCGAASCSQDKAAPVATAPVTTEDGAARSLNIRYINADSIMSGYVLAQQIADEGQRMMLSYQREEQQKQQELQNLGNNIAQKQQNNAYLTQESYETDVRNFQNKQNSAANYLGQRQEKIQQTMAAAQLRLNDSIRNCARDFAVANGFDAIVMSDAGVYFNPELDVTAALLQVLNDRYNKAE